MAVSSTISGQVKPLFWALLATFYFKEQSCLSQAARSPALVLRSLREQTEPLNLTFNMHNSHGQRISCRKVGMEQTNPDHSPGDLCLMSLQSISRRALGKGSGAIALVWVLLTWSSDTSENFCQQGLYRRCNFLAAGAAKNKVPPRPSGPSYPKKGPRVC